MKHRVDLVFMLLMARLMCSQLKKQDLAKKTRSLERSLEKLV